MARRVTARPARAHPRLVRACRLSTLIFLLTTAGACAPDAEPGSADGADLADAADSTAAGADTATDATPALLTVFDSLPGAIRLTMAPWTGDLSGMVDRRVVRLLTVHEPQWFGFDGRRQVGIVADAAVLLEDFLNARLERGHPKVHVVIYPVSRDLVLPFLEEGRGDIVAAGLTMTPERLERFDFGEPVMRGVSEIVVTGPGVTAPARLEDLGSIPIHVRRSSSGWDGLQALDRRLRASGQTPLDLHPVDELLGDGDILELVGAGGLPATVVEDYQATFWSQMVDGLELHPELAVRSDLSLGWAVRRGSPELRGALDEWVRANRQGTLIGNTLIRRYTRDTVSVVRARAFRNTNRFFELRELFERYGEQYDLDWLLLAAQAYQESGFNNDAKSHVGAVGLMQLLPAAAIDVGVDDISTPEGNVHAGAAYLRYLIDTYFDDPALDMKGRQTFAMAGYNAGPSRIRTLRREAGDAGLDPDSWFGNVEIVVAREVGREPVTYIGNIIKYYIAFSLLAHAAELREGVGIP